MSLFRRGEIWYGSYSTPGGKRIKESLGTKDKRQAQELHDRRKAELWRIERLGDFPDVTFEEACLRWIEEKADKKSLDDDKSRMGFWLMHFEGMRLKDITEAKVYTAVSKMTNRRYAANWLAQSASREKKGKEVPAFIGKQVSIATKAKHLALMKALLRAAERDWKWIEKAPVIKVPQVKNKRVRWLTPEEAKRLIDECPEPLKSTVIFALATGLRRSNIIDLEWQQIDMQRKVAWINPEDSKSGKAIGVALNNTACSVLRAQLGKHHRWVFVHTKAKNRSDGTLTPTVRKMRVDSNSSWRSALKRAGIENFRFHDLRHTWASWLVQAGVPLSILQEMGGWESIEMVRRYAHLAPNHLTEHAKQIDAIWGGNVPNMSQLDTLEVMGFDK
ncbi:tyrosine-type recombinase/integrase [Yersinia enterocolitica]|uniref:integrase n=1 Tax=Yersinia enterocolitica TaxID=630 RepID=UPI001C60939B|nr:site-specific integrase [Yersinia enterocolitica]MBW5852825.1 site-specific integrase [Yersinia enterocolitica]MBX9475944.1 site-specific integrase [Yersinia enterocolitica]